MFLTKLQVEDLTGYHRHADQRRWLTERGWVFETAANGRPVVSVSYAEERLGNSGKTKWQPNLSALA